MKLTELLAWNYVFATLIVIAAFTFASSADDKRWKKTVEQAVFQECFEYYSEIQEKDGISLSSIAICVEKAKDWADQLSEERNF